MVKNTFRIISTCLLILTLTELISAQDISSWITSTKIHSSNDMKRVGNIIDKNTETVWTPDVWIEKSYWVVLDLQNEYEVDKIRSWHRRQWDRETGIDQIFVSNNINDWGESIGSLQSIYNQPAGWFETSVTKKTGRYVKLVSSLTKNPNWREIEISGLLSQIVSVKYSLSISSLNGNIVKTPDLVKYDEGANVLLTAIADEGYTFTGWEGDAAGNTNPLQVVMDTNKNISANFIIQTDTEAPSVPQNLSVNVSGLQVNLFWSASTDNIEVIGYKVFRDGNLLGSTSIPSYSDSTPEAGTYVYNVSAYDAMNNESILSSSVTAVVAGEISQDKNWFTPFLVNSSNDALRTGNIIDKNFATAWTPNVWIEQSYWVVLDLGEGAVVDKLRSIHPKRWDSESAITEIYLTNNLSDFGTSVGNLERIQNQTEGWKEVDLPDGTYRYIKLVSEITTSPYWREIEIAGQPGEQPIIIPDDPDDPVDPGTPPVSVDSSDVTPPSTVAEVRDGLTFDQIESTQPTQLSANWDISIDNENQIVRYWFSIGTTSGGTEILTWTSSGLNRQVTRNGLYLSFGTTYYFNVRAENALGLISEITSSNGIKIVDNLSPEAREVHLTVEEGTDISDDITSAARYLESIGGGTIFLPAGEFLFATCVNMNGGISLIGQGENATILNSRTAGFFDINHFGNKGGSLRISGIGFNGWTSDANYTHRGISLANIVDFRIDHCYFEGFGYTINPSGNAQNPKPRGVVDHCTIIRGRGVYTSMYGVTTGPYLFDGTSNIDYLGTREAVFVEDCYIEGCSHATDGFGGGHYVLRNSVIVDCGSVGGHGPGFESTGRGIRCTEVYNNQIIKSASASEGLRWCGYNVRGGGGVLFNNRFENCRYAIQFTLDSGSFTDENGDGLYDYPALDQTHEKWIWNNELITTPVLWFYYGDPAAQLVLEGRDFFFRAPDLETDGFTYTPYPYPHYLVTDGISLSKNTSQQTSKTISEKNELPVEFGLNQNYPNPFNPSTTIEFSIPYEGFYQVNIFNTLGEIVSVLADNKFQPGSHKLLFDASDLPSGIYFYQLTGHGFNQVKKMLLLK